MCGDHLRDLVESDGQRVGILYQIPAMTFPVDAGRRMHALAHAAVRLPAASESEFRKRGLGWEMTLEGRQLKNSSND
jgi:hypothetical protein